MHMSDALLSPPVAVAAGVAAAALIVPAGRQVKRSPADSRLVPMMGVMGAFVFAAQMINFTIPGTGSSGHIVGGILLAAFLGPWAAFLTLASVIIIQCLIFADGGLMALGCNIINMGAMSCLVGYPLIFKPIVGRKFTNGRIVAASLLACVASLELGAVAVVGETELSGITALPAGPFLAFMTPIHLLIGIGEGLATAAVLCFVKARRPELIEETPGEALPGKSFRKAVVWFAIAAVVLGCGLAWFASSNPDGLEWSIEKVAGTSELVAEHTTSLTTAASAVQASTAVIPDYSSSLSGIIGSAMVVLLVWVVVSLIRRPAGAVQKVDNENNPS